MTNSRDSEFLALQALRTRRPLVHNITNYVAMTISANVLLARQAPKLRSAAGALAICRRSCAMPCI